MASPCVTSSGPHASCANSFRQHQSSGRFEREMRNDHLFSLTLTFLDAEPEEKKESSFLCLSISTFLFSGDIFAQRETLTKGESE